jgi:hypothetical protein
MVKFEMEYIDAVVVEFALVDFIDWHRRRVSKLHAIKDKTEPEITLLKVYEARIRNAKKALGVVGVSLTEFSKLEACHEEA